ncbi:hypothetical protein DFH06DRAFT_1479757 [Mycena polygramma]|nr:hypothetical protein DFH06DRAFT_1479757 [Mycena polygramma]
MTATPEPSRLQKAAISRMYMNHGASVFNPLPLPRLSEDQWNIILNDRTSRRLFCFLGDMALQDILCSLVSARLEAAIPEFNTLENHHAICSILVSATTSHGILASTKRYQADASPLFPDADPGDTAKLFTAYIGALISSSQHGLRSFTPWATHVYGHIAAGVVKALDPAFMIHMRRVRTEGEKAAAKEARASKKQKTGREIVANVSALKGRYTTNTTPLRPVVNATQEIAHQKSLAIQCKICSVAQSSTITDSCEYRAAVRLVLVLRPAHRLMAPPSEAEEDAHRDTPKKETQLPHSIE